MRWPVYGLIRVLNDHISTDLSTISVDKRIIHEQNALT